MQEPPLRQLLHLYRLADESADGVACNENGLSVGGTPLLVRVAGPTGQDCWRVRPVANINRGLTLRYGLPVDVAEKVAGLSIVAGALDDGDLLHAQFAALHLRFPDPPPLFKASGLSGVEAAVLVLQLHASGLLKGDWNPDLHPRWPVGSPQACGGNPVGYWI